MNLREGLLIGLRRGYEFAAKLSNEKFRVCRFWKSPVHNVAGISSVPQVSFSDTVAHMKFVHVIQMCPRACRNNDLDHARIIIGHDATFNAPLHGENFIAECSRCDSNSVPCSRRYFGALNNTRTIAEDRLLCSRAIDLFDNLRQCRLL